MPEDGSSFPQGADVHFEPRPQRRSIATDLRGTPIDAPQGRVGERGQGRQDDGGTPSTCGGRITRPEATTQGARLSALEGTICIPLQRDCYFFSLCNDLVPFPLTLRTARADEEVCDNRNPKTMPTGTLHFRRQRCILILRDIRHFGSAALGATNQCSLVLIAVDGTL